MGDGRGRVTRAVVFPLDVSPSEERLLLSYCGARRFAYNWVVASVSENLAVRRAERVAGVPEDRLTPAVSWSAQSLGMRWNEVKDEVAPWWREVSMHAFRSGVVDAAAALKNWSDSRSGKRKGPMVGFPRFKKKDRTVPSVSFVEINHQLSWLHPDRHHVRLMLPRSSPDEQVRRRAGQLAWVHTVESTGALYRLVEAGEATIQKLTIARRGGRWQASFLVRYTTAPARKAVKYRGGLVGVDAGVKHLLTTSVPVPGLTDDDGHVANPKVLDSNLRELRRLDRAVARARRGSKNHRRLLGRRARLHGRIAKTRALHLHPVTTRLAGAFDVVAVEDLNVKGIANKKRRLGRRLADASLGEIRRQFNYKAVDFGRRLVAVDRFYPSSKTCSACGKARATLPLGERVFRCDHCGLTADRDVNAARTIAGEARRLLEQEQHDQQDQSHVAGLRPETENADRRRRKTRKAQADLAAVA
ncbi:MAG: IS607 family element RNA-guided endonuclease TnpB [Acidimicrobiia bacterium]